MPVIGEVQGAQAGASPDGGGVSPVGASAERNRGIGNALGGNRHPLAEPLPAGQDSNVSLGERGLGGWQTAVARRQDRRADGIAVGDSGGRARRLASRPGQPLGHRWQEAGRPSFNAPWRRTRARLDDVRIHDLRHNSASRAPALGESLPMIGKLPGHAQARTTARYAHPARDWVKASASRIADSIGADIPAREPGCVNAWWASAGDLIVEGRRRPLASLHLKVQMIHNIPLQDLL